MVQHSINLIKSYNDVVLDFYAGVNNFQIGGGTHAPNMNLVKDETLALLDTDPSAVAKELFFRDDLIVLSHGIQGKRNQP